MQSLINVCKTLRSSDEVYYVHPVQQIIDNKHMVFLILAATHSWCFSYHKSNSMRMAVISHVKVQLSHYLVSRNSRCLRKRTVKKTDALSDKPSWLQATNNFKDLAIQKLHRVPASEGNSCPYLFNQCLVSWGLTLHTLLRVLFSSAWEREHRGKKIIYLLHLVGSKSPSTMMINAFQSPEEKILCTIWYFDITAHGRAKSIFFQLPE